MSTAVIAGMERPHFIYLFIYWIIVVYELVQVSLHLLQQVANKPQC